MGATASARLDEITGREARERAEQAQSIARAREEARRMCDRLRGVLGKDAPERDDPGEDMDKPQDKSRDKPKTRDRGREPDDGYEL